MAYFGPNRDGLWEVRVDFPDSGSYSKSLAQERLMWHLTSLGVIPKSMAAEFRLAVGLVLTQDAHGSFFREVPSDTRSAFYAEAMEHRISEILRDLQVDVPGKIQAHHIPGVRGSVRGCPVSNYLKFKTSHHYPIRSTWDYIIATCDFLPDPKEVRIPTPKRVREFMHRFDRGEYPDIIV